MAGPFTYPVAVAVPFDGTEDSGGTPVTPPFVSDNVRDGIIEARNSAPGTAARFTVPAGFKGNASTNKWLEVFQSVPSSNVPFVIAEAGEIKALSVAVKNNSTATFTVYKNGSSVASLSLAAQKTNFQNSFTIALIAGDELSFQVTAGSAQDVIFNTFIQVAV